MPLWKCNDCHHEWEGSDEDNRCDWCESEGHIIQEKTGLEELLDEEPRCVSCDKEMRALYFMGELLEGYVCPTCNKLHPWIDGKLADPIGAVIY